MKKRILTMLLAAVMLTCLLPMTALADTEIEPFNLVLRAPETGYTPGEAYAAKDEYSYSTPWSSLHVYSAETTWTYVNEADVTCTVAAEELMKPETEYTAHIKLILVSGYVFGDLTQFTLMQEPVEVESWDPVQPWVLTIKKTYPPTAPLTPVEKVELTATAPLYGKHIDETVDCPYHYPYTIDQAAWYDSSDMLLTAADSFLAGETYTLTVSLKAKDYAKFTAEDLPEENCNLNPDWLGRGMHPSAIRILGDDAAELDFTWTVPEPIDSLTLFTAVQAYGEHPNNYAWTEPDANYWVEETQWFDIEWLHFITSEDILTKGHEYNIEIDVYPAEGHTLSATATATLNGVDCGLVEDHGDFVTVRASGPVKDAEEIHEVDLTYTAPVDVGLEAVDWAEVPEDGHYELVTAVWYDGEGNDIYHFDFEDGKTYTLKFTLAPEMSYVFADDAVFRINGEEAAVTADGRERTVAKTFSVSSWHPSVTAEGVFDLTTGAGIGDYTAERATLRALGEAGLITERVVLLECYYDLDKDGTEDIRIGPTEGDLSKEYIKLLDTRSIEGEWAMSLNEAALDCLKAELAPAYYESMKFIFPELVWVISFEAGGGSGEMPADEVKRGEKYILPECSFTPPEDQVFDSWSLGLPGEEVDIADNWTIQAKWRDRYWIVSFWASEGSGEMASVKVEKGEKYTLPECSFTPPEGQEFERWDLGEAGKEIEIDTDTLITALWKDKVYWTISFDANGGSGEMEPVKVEDGTSYALPECLFEAPEGKEFEKWDQGEAGSEFFIGGDLTIQALWKDKPAECWTVSFDANGGSGEMADIQVEKGKTLALPDCTFDAPEGKQFDAWDLGGPGSEVEITGDVAVKAQWKDKEAVLVNPFDDVQETDYFYDAVLWAYYAEPQVTNGMDATHFGPANTVTRGQAVTFLWRAMGCPEPETAENPFEDVTESKYYYKAVLWANEKGITIGTDATHFTPNQTCSTAHILTFLYRTMGVGDDGWYAVAEAWAKGAGLLDGLEIEVAPKVDCPRCDVVLFLCRQLAK